MEIDVRGPGTLEITSIRYSRPMVLMGSAATEDITAVNRETNQQVVICKKNEIDDLIEALRAVKRFWV